MSLSSINFDKFSIFRSPDDDILSKKNSFQRGIRSPSPPKKKVMYKTQATKFQNSSQPFSLARSFLSRISRG